MRKTIVLSLALFAACDSDNNSGSGIAATQIDESLANTYCEVLSDCALTGDAAVFGALAAASDLNACRTFFTRFFEEKRTSLEGRVTSGANTYDSAAFAQCLTDMKAACDLVEISRCEAAFEGKVALGGTCESDLDCAGDARCSVSRSSGDACTTAVCIARVAAGQACVSDSDCNQSSGPMACAVDEDICVPLTRETNLAEGAPCDETSSATGVTLRSCANGLACVDEETEGADRAFCRKPLASGSNCTETELPCAQGLLCLPDSGAETQSCQTLSIATTVGADCNYDEDAGPIVVCSVIDQLGCDNGKCRRWGDGEVGAYCDSGFETEWSCDRGHYCSASSTCAAQKAAGAECEQSNECLDRYCDNSEQTGVCVALSICP